MPIYAFACDSCGHQFERLQRLSDPDPAVCPNCGVEQVRRQLTAPSFRLAGAGWYETDFKKEGDSKRNLADKGEPVAKPEAQPDKTPEAKSDTGVPAKADPPPAAKPTPPAAGAP